MPKETAEEYINRIIREFKNRLVYDPNITINPASREPITEEWICCRRDKDVQEK